MLIAGPCVIESERHAMRMAERLVKIAAKAKIPLIFKASYDKANRSSLSSFRGPGPREGLEILRKIEARFRVPLLTDIHEPAQAAAAAEVCDVLQVPAFLSRQTDLLIAAGKTGRVVNLKKGQFLSPWEMANAVEKVKSTGNKKIVITERGVSFGYNNLVADMRSFSILAKTGCPVIFDVTHCRVAEHDRNTHARPIPRLWSWSCSARSLRGQAGSIFGTASSSCGGCGVSVAVR